MPKHSRKRQKFSTDEPNPLTDDAAKDDEERRLESLLFGTKYIPADSEGVLQQGTETAGGEGRQLQNLLDDDLFFVDDQVEHDSNQSDQEPNGSSSGSDSHSEDEEDTEEVAIIEQTNTLAKSLKSHHKAAAWIDESEPTRVSLSSKRLKKLRNTTDEETLTGREYESRLRRQFERINPEPDWAAKARKKHSQFDDDFDSETEINFSALLSSTSGIRQSRSSRSKILASETIDISRLRDVNQAAQNAGCGDIKSLAFHPSERVPVLCVGSSDRRVRLYNIDGHTSPLLQTLHIPSLPLSSQSSITFHPSGSQLLLTGSRPYYFIYDLQSGTLSSSDQNKHGLWGTRFEDTSTTLQVPIRSRKRGRTRGEGIDESAPVDPQGNITSAPGMEVTAFEPSTGSILAVAGRGGYVHLVDWKSGAGQVVGSLKCSNGGGGVKGLWWMSPSNERSPEADTGSREYLTVLTGDSEVYLWDVGERRCVRRWKDEGGFRGAGRVITGNGKGSGWLAIGSNTGLVNVYGSDSFTPSAISSSSLSSSWSSLSPKPLKTIKNLITPISTLRFNHDAQVLAVASKEKKDGMRLIHLPSLTSFSNWPTSSTPLGHVTAVDFSARSEYIAISNTRGRVLLYHLKNFGAH